MLGKEPMGGPFSLAPFRPSQWVPRGQEVGPNSLFIPKLLFRARSSECSHLGAQSKARISELVPGQVKVLVPEENPCKSFLRPEEILSRPL